MDNHNNVVDTTSNQRFNSSSALYINDRYIPNRALSNIELSHHLLHNITNTHLHKRPRVLNLHTRESAIYSPNKYLNRKSIKRYIPSNPERVLDAPELKDDFYLNLIDWSSDNIISAPLLDELYLWNETDRKTTLLIKRNPEDLNGYLASTSWMKTKNDQIAVGFSNGHVDLWNVAKQKCIQKMQPQASRVGVLCWNQNMLTSGSLKGFIHQYDERLSHHVCCLKGHEQEVCGIKWSPDGRFLASGGNDNIVSIWDVNMLRDSRPLHVLKEHTAAVKALSWCPWRSNILATGGGRFDGKIKLWNIYSGASLKTVETGSQISSLLWSEEFKEIVSSHSGPLNELNIWKSSDMSKVNSLIGHSSRVLSMVLSPDRETVLTAGADETLRLWKCFGLSERQKRQKLSKISDRIDSALCSSKFIR